MANYEGSVRSNYVQVKKGWELLFRERAERAGFRVEEDKRGFALFKDDGSISDYYEYDKDGEYINGEEIIDWGKDFGRLLEDGEVLHLVESGHEKLRYLTGVALFVRSDGKIYSVNINDVPTWVNKFAKKHGREITDATY